MRRTNPAHRKRGGTSRGRQSRREERDYEIPEVYQEMLAEAEARDPQGSEINRPVKRRKVGERATVSSLPESRDQEAHKPESSEDVGGQMQTAYDSTASDDESDMEWEDVDIQQAPPNLDQAASFSKDEPLQITLDQRKDNAKRIIPRRKPITAAERKLRLDVHKAHLLCLLGHVKTRNLWCNDEEVQGFLKKMLPKKVVALLNPAEDKPQHTRSITFVDGLNQASDTFVRRFKVTKPGLQRAHWTDGPDLLKQKVETILSNAEVILSRDDFIKQAKILHGSRDFGAQIFCALLRSVAVEARLVCSLQPLPFSGAAMPTTPKTPASQSIIIASDEHESDEQAISSVSSTPPPRVKRLGQPQFTSPNDRKTSVHIGSRPSVRESSYPVFWVEAYNEAVQKWIPVDPLVTKSLAKPSKFEPPASDQRNIMSYVVAFEDDASARDVTRRYAKAFSSKTRKLRVESTRNGERWWARALRFYEKPFLEDRDEAEISELTAKMAAEPMPRNVQDFKDHPIYALERHLRRNEVISPKRVIGQVSLGKSTSKNQKLEPVYRRSDVHTCRSADGWYRLGRDIKMGEQPLKRVRGDRNQFDINEDEDSIVEIPIYAHFQTEVYKPPPVVQGRIPKNAYGNLDIYTPSMVPPGGVHIVRPGTSHAAKILGVDYADAVTGFDFKGRHGTAVVRGAIVANEYREAIEEVLDGLENDRLQAELEERSAEVLGMWKHFLLRLRIAERVKGYAVEGDEGDGHDNETNNDVGDDNYREVEDSGGGFFPESGEESNSPYVPLVSRDSIQQDLQEAGGFVPDTAEFGFGEDEALGGGFIPEETSQDVHETKPSHSTIGGDTEHVNRAYTAEPSHYTLVVVPGNKTSAATKTEPELSGNATSIETSQSTSRSEMKSSEQDIPTNYEGSSGISIPAGLTTAEDTKPSSITMPSQDAVSEQSRAPSPESTRMESGSNEEGSLMSEDPEDEDAIPEWLM